MQNQIVNMYLEYLPALRARYDMDIYLSVEDDYNDYLKKYSKPKFLIVSDHVCYSDEDGCSVEFEFRFELSLECTGSFEIKEPDAHLKDNHWISNIEDLKKWFDYLLDTDRFDEMIEDSNIDWEDIKQHNEIESYLLTN